MRALAALAACACLAGCDAHRFDASQVPDVRVTTGGGAPVFSWTPAGAHYLRVYEGASTRGGLAPIVWDVSKSGTAKNALASPIAYGTVPASGRENVPARPLVRGRSYVVEVFRDDPKGSGEGFTNTSKTYRDTLVFVAP